MNKAFYFIAFLLLPSITFGAELKPLTTDGCSVFPDGTIEHQSLWAHCCIRHDIAYWQGGTYDERLKADQSLEQCVSEVGEPEIAQLMLTGVRAGGSPYFPSSYRWGYGWPYSRGYKALTKEEKTKVIKNLKSLEILIKGILKEIKP
ncbi:MAG: hypothetical protein KAT04_00445 [Methylococcales bacterium]|nr:hypothetical protein [Methylococcales bacterium]